MEEEQEGIHSEEHDYEILSADRPERLSTDSSGQDFEEGRPQEFDSNEPREELNPLSPENIPKVVLIQLARLYDVQLAMLTCIDTEFAAYIGDLHSKGLFFGPDPAISVDAEE